jgi:hypothetical protein
MAVVWHAWPFFGGGWDHYRKVSGLGKIFFRMQIGRSGWQWKFFKACWVDRWPGDDIFFFMNWRAGKLCSRCFLSFTGENGETLACERHHFTKLPSLF